MSISRVAVAGAGTMGAGIAQIACLGGLETYLHDPVADALATGEARLCGHLAEGVDRGRWSASEAEAASARLRATPRLDDLAGCELVIEAAPEDLELKRALFARLAEACGPEAILATNTSSLSVTAIAAGVAGPQRVCGMHFFNPPALMRLVEIVAGDETADATLVAALAVAERMGRTPIRVADGIGFLANRCARPFSLEALRLLADGVADHATIDRIVRLGGGYRMGPFEVIDLVGADVNLRVARSFWEQSFGEPRWRPHPLQQRLVDAGRLGRKSGRGWYEYASGPHRPDDPVAPDPDPGAAPDERVEEAVRWIALPDLERARMVELARLPSTTDAEAEAAEAHFRALGKHVEWVRDAPGLVLGRIVAQLINEACFAVGEGVGEPEDVDTALRLGFNHPRGPFEWARAVGPERALALLDALRGELGDERYRPAPLLRRWVAAGTPDPPT